MQALKRIARSEDNPEAIAFLASNETRWVTGGTTHVDGGWKL